MNRNIIYYQKQEVLISPIAPYKNAAYIQEDVEKGLNPYVAYLKRSIEVLKTKEIKIPFERMNAGYEANPNFVLIESLQTVEIEIDTRPGWFAIRRNESIADFIKIKELKFKLNAEDIKQEHFDNWTFIFIPNTERKKYKIEIGDFDEYEAFPAWASAETEIVFTQKGKEVRITQTSEGKFETTIESLSSLVPALEINERVLRIRNLPEEIPKLETPAEWHELKAYNIWLAPRNAIIPAGFRRLDGEKEKEIALELLKIAAKEKRLQVLEESNAYKLSGELAKNDNKELLIEKTNFSFKLSEIPFKKSDPNSYWLQLKEPEKQNDDDFAERSPLEYFFDDDVEVQFLDEKGGFIDENGKPADKDKNVSFRVDERNRKTEEKQIVLKQGRDYILPPPKTKELKLKVNTYQLERQLDAVYALMKAPLPHLEPLVRALLKRIPEKDTFWQYFLSEDEVIDWQVLTDPTRDGTHLQREFVEKALAAPDFVIMEGPPGSGKTTAILELIAQLARRGKRVLLCASTHVAIDNVLERLIEKPELMNDILPVRIGDKARVQENVQKFQLDELKQIKDIDGAGLYQNCEQLLLEAANLICGTTLGILQLPLIKNADKSRPRQPVFDYIIIDECSKTTFTEFLVPALYARKWVLVGDVRQLSPYVERDWLSANLEKLKYRDNENIDHSLPPELQSACLTLSVLYPYPISLNSQKSRTNDNERREPCYNAYVRVKEAVFVEIENEYRSRIEPVYGLNGKKIHFHYGRDGYSDDALVVIHDEDYRSEHLFYDRFVINDIKWTASAHAFRFQAWYQKTKENRGLDYHLRSKGENIPYPFNISEILNGELQKTWANEVAWRLATLYELRMKEQMAEKTPNKKNLTAQIDRRESELKRLYPAQTEYDWVERGVNNLREAALPSVLSILQEGLPKKWRQEASEPDKRKRESTLQSGFRVDELEPRFVRLAFQHRMHPDISAFPRKQFYNNEALQDPQDMELRRKWGYDRYPKRAVWADVPNGNVYRNANEKEAAALANELDHFLKWAEKNPQKENKKWEIAVITFYKGQERALRKELSKLLAYPKEYMGQYFTEHRAQSCKVSIKLNTVDRFQGQEADIVFLSMVQTNRVGFMSSPNRLNVAITRARYQLVILGKKNYFATQNESDDLKALASDLSIFNLPKK